MFNKESIAVYNPSDPVEKAIQEAYHKYNSDWLPSYTCQLMARAIVSLKRYSRWIDDENLTNIRMSYLFDPKMIHKDKEVVFATSPLFLRDILENGVIDGYLHNPAVFMSPRLCYWLFREHSVHVYFNESLLKSGSGQVKFHQVGGFIMVDGRNVNVDKNMITKIRTTDHHELIAGIVSDCEKQPLLNKAAEIEISRDVFKIGPSERILSPNLRIWDKQDRRYAVIDSVQPGHLGEISIRYDDGDTAKLIQSEFDPRYSVV